MQNRNSINNVNVLSNKPKVLRSMCDMLGDKCKDYTVDLLTGNIDDTEFMNRLIDAYGQSRVNNAVFSSVALEKNNINTNTSSPYQPYQNPSIEASNMQGNDQPDDIIPDDSQEKGECPICLSPAIFGVGKSVCEILADGRRNGTIDNNELNCNDIVDDFAQGKISNRDMVALLIEAYGEDQVVTALNQINSVIEDGIMTARNKKM